MRAFVHLLRAVLGPSAPLEFLIGGAGTVTRLDLSAQRGGPDESDVVKRQTGAVLWGGQPL